jgi:hypothetical protein
MFADLLTLSIMKSMAWAWLRSVICSDLIFPMTSFFKRGPGRSQNLGIIEYNLFKQ